MLKCLTEIHLETRFKRSNRKPLVLRGARQVGKSTWILYEDKNQLPVVAAGVLNEIRTQS